jgi:hypothetical protein
MELKLRLFAKKDIPVVESFIKAGEEVRIGKISSSRSAFMVICKNDNMHKWLNMEDYPLFIEDKLVDID